MRFAVTADLLIVWESAVSAAIPSWDEGVSLLRRRHRFTLHIVWVPEHVDVAGNELADVHAKRAATDDNTVHDIKPLQRGLSRSVAAVRAAYKHTVAAQRTAWWIASPAAEKLRRVDSCGSGAHVRRLYHDLPRRSASLLTQLRTGRIGLNDFLARIKVEWSARCTTCHVPETVDHYLLHCSRSAPQRHLLRTRLQRALSLPFLLNKPSSIPALLRYINDTQRFPQYLDDETHLPPLKPKSP